MKKLLNGRVAAVAVSAAALVAVGSAGTAVAAGMIGSADIRDGAVHRVDLSAGVNKALARHAAPGAKGATGATGAKGVKGDSGLEGAVYRVENYTNGGGGSATVACADNDPDGTQTTSQKYTAIAGGVQGSTVDDQSPNGFEVSSSFPGRMDWDTNSPKPNRLDGWIVLGNGNYTGTLKVWALCVPTASIPVQQVDLAN